MIPVLLMSVSPLVNLSPLIDDAKCYDWCAGIGGPRAPLPPL